MICIHTIQNWRQAIAAHRRDRASTYQTNPLEVEGRETISGDTLSPEYEVDRPGKGYNDEGVVH